MGVPSLSIVSLEVGEPTHDTQSKLSVHAAGVDWSRSLQIQVLSLVVVVTYPLLQVVEVEPQGLVLKIN